MVQARLTILLAGLCLLASSCAVPKESIKTDRFSYRWEKAMMTGSRTGVTAVVGSGVEKALGRVVILPLQEESMRPAHPPP